MSLFFVLILYILSTRRQLLQTLKTHKTVNKSPVKSDLCVFCLNGGENTGFMGLSDQIWGGRANKNQLLQQMDVSANVLLQWNVSA